MELVTAAVPWPVSGRARRAGVSSFGISGTNAHVILEEFVDGVGAVESLASCVAATLPLPFFFSAKTSDALREQASRLLSRVGSAADSDLADIAWSMLSGRAELEHRCVVFARDGAELRRTLASVGHGEDAAIQGVARSAGRLGFLFSGQGSQRAGMGSELYETFPAFASAFDEVCAHIDPLWQVSLREIVFDDRSAISDRTEFAQPALFAIEYALFRLLETFGLAPDYVMGHSVGEIAAACIAGVFSVADAAHLVVARGRLMQALPECGAMAALQASESEVIPLLGDTLDIAAVNGPRSIVVSGISQAVDEIVAHFAASGRKTTRLRVSHAFHSHLMAPMLAEFEKVCADVTFGAPRISLVSTVTGDRISEEISTPAYWVRHARATVRFADAVTVMAETGVSRFVEIGPDANLASMVRECLTHNESASVMATMRGGRSEHNTLLTTLAELHVTGTPISWVTHLGGGRIVDLPTYPFQRRRYWLEPQSATGDSNTDSAFWDLIDRTDLDGLRQQLGIDSAAPLAEAIPALSRWHTHRRHLATLDNWSYQLQWASVTGLSERTAAGRWLLVLPTELADDSVAGVLVTASGLDLLVLTVAPTEDRSTLTARLIAAASSPIAGVISLLAAQTGHDPDHEAVPFGLRATTTLSQALGDADLGVPLWLVTRDAMGAVSGDRVTGADQAVVWGLARVAAVEFPHRWGGIVDLPAECDSATVALFGRVLTGTAGDQVALRNRRVLARRMIRTELSSAQPWEPSGTILVTGGTGALGSHVARWLADHGAAHLVLVGRRGMDAPAAAALHDDLRARGAEVTIEACDIGDRDAVAELLARIPDRHPLTAVVHAAGQLDDCTIDNLTPERMSRALRAKLLGARHLDELTRHLDLTAFVLFSSIGATFGAYGQANYAPGNAFLDALAERRRGNGLRATSIAWGPWAGDGMAAALHRLQDWSGIPGMSPDRAVGALRYASGHDRPHLLVADVDWSRWPARAALPDPLYALIPDVLAERGEAEPTGTAPPLRTRLESTGETEREQLLLEAVCRHAGAVLGHGSSSAVANDRAFRDLGFDSLAAVELRNRLVADTGIALPPTILFDHPTVWDLTRHILDELDFPVVGADISPLGQLDQLEATLATVVVDDPGTRDRIAARLRTLAASWAHRESAPVAAELESADDEELLAFIRTEFGKS
ncbi:SDR family NAD(P)-dependent oxidoreductase [Nocardia sp. NPDC055002]